MGFRVFWLWFRVLEFRVGFMVWGFRFWVLEFRVGFIFWGLGFYDLEFWDVGFRVKDLGFGA